MSRLLALVCALAVLASCLTGCVAAPPIILIQTRVGDCPTSPAPTSAASLNTPGTAAPTALATPTAPLISPTPTPVEVRLCFAPDAAASSGDVPDVYRRFIAELGRHTSLALTPVVPKDDLAAIEALCAAEVDAAWLATPAYLLARERCEAVPRFRGLRLGMAEVRGQIMVQSERARQARNLPPIRSLGDLNGRTVGYTEPGSITGHLFPKALLVQAGAKPAEEVFLAGDGQAALAVYRGEVDAAAGYWAPPRADGLPGDARSLLLPTYPDALAVVQVLQLTGPIPGDPLVFGAHLPPEVDAQLQLALVEMARHDAGRALLRELYGLGGLAPTGPQDYDQVLDMAAALQLDLAELLQTKER
ncbi:MAG: PhnD/SsuA/transferrin family substrate-binding protein [Chloroflexota bacterium]